MRALSRRLLAYMADCALLFAVLAPLAFATQRVLGVAPVSGGAVYAALLLHFSLPAWVYFARSDCSARGATPGKRLLVLHARTHAGERIGAWRALGRTAVKMLPWELTHVAAFLLAPAPGTLGPASLAGLSLVYALLIAYLVTAWQTSGRRSVHDFAAGTAVDTSTATDAPVS